MTNLINNPGQPYLLNIPGGLSPGKIAHITGTFTVNATSFVLKFQSGPYGDPADEIGLCLYARLMEGVVGMNAFTKAGGWGQEEAYPWQGFVRGQSFEVTILSDPYRLKVAFNGQHWAEYSHRMNPALLSHLNVASGPNDIILSCLWIEDPNQVPGQGPYPPMGTGPFPPNVQQNYLAQNSAYPSYSPHGEKSGKGLMGMVESAGAAVASALGTGNILGKQKGYPSYGGGYPNSQPQYPGGQTNYGAYPGNQPQYGGYPSGHKSSGGGLLGKAMAVGGGILGAKAMSKGVGGLGGGKAMKYGLPLAGAGLGGYMLTKGVKKGFGGFGDFGDSFECCSDSD